jgi:hypothetical protein
MGRTLTFSMRYAIIHDLIEMAVVRTNEPLAKNEMLHCVQRDRPQHVMLRSGATKHPVLPSQEQGASLRRMTLQTGGACHSEPERSGGEESRSHQRKRDPSLR